MEPTSRVSARSLTVALSVEGRINVSMSLQSAGGSRLNGDSSWPGDAPRPHVFPSLAPTSTNGPVASIFTTVPTPSAVSTATTIPLQPRLLPDRGRSLAIARTRHSAERGEPHRGDVPGGAAEAPLRAVGVDELVGAGGGQVVGDDP